MKTCRSPTPIGGLFLSLLLALSLNAPQVHAWSFEVEFGFYDTSGYGSTPGDLANPPPLLTTINEGTTATIGIYAATHDPGLFEWAEMVGHDLTGVLTRASDGDTSTFTDRFPNYYQSPVYGYDSIERQFIPLSQTTFGSNDTYTLGVNGWIANEYLNWGSYVTDRHWLNALPDKTLTVLNVAPTITSASAAGTLYEGSDVLFNIGAYDPGVGDHLDVFVNDEKKGTMSGSLAPGQDGNRLRTLNFGTFSEGSHSVDIRLNDSDDDSASVTRTFTVNNVAASMSASVVDQWHPDVVSLVGGWDSLDLLPDPPPGFLYEGQVPSFAGTVSDPGEDDVDLYINGDYKNTLSTTGWGNFFWYGADGVGAQWQEGHFSADLALYDQTDWSYFQEQWTVLNADPILLDITEDLTVMTGMSFDFFADVIDPGINDILNYAWDLDGDNVYDDLFGATGSWVFDNLGTHAVSLRVSDGDGGFVYGSFNVDVYGPQVPEPVTALLVGTALIGFGGFRRKVQIH